MAYKFSPCISLSLFLSFSYSLLIIPPDSPRLSPLSLLSHDPDPFLNPFLQSMQYLDVQTQ